MEVSVVIPAYNEEKHITACLESLSKQTEKPLEIIVVDNNCSDNTVEIARRYGVRVVKEKKQGMIYARNKGFNEARGTIIARCDADSIVSPNWIGEIIKHFGKRKRIDALTGPVIYHDFRVKNILPIFKTYFTTVHKVLGHYPLTGPNMAITRAMWNKVRDSVCLDDSVVHEDIDLSIHIDQVGGRIVYDRKLIVAISARRLRNDPASMLIEYPARVVKTIKKHYSLYEKLNENLLKD